MVGAKVLAPIMAPAGWLVSWLLLFGIGLWQSSAALAALILSSARIALALSREGRVITPFLRTGRIRHSGAVAGCGPAQLAHRGGQQCSGLAAKHCFLGCLSVVWLVVAQISHRAIRAQDRAGWYPWQRSH